MSKQLGIDLRTWLLAVGGIDTIVDGRVHQNHAPESYQGAYIWIGRGGMEPADELNEGPAVNPFTEFWDVEIYSRDIDETEDLAELVHSLAPMRGGVGSGTVQRLTITDHADDYLPKGMYGDDDGLHLAALQVTVMGYAPAP